MVSEVEDGHRADPSVSPEGHGEAGAAEELLGRFRPRAANDDRGGMLQDAVD